MPDDRQVQAISLAPVCNVLPSATLQQDRPRVTLASAVTDAGPLARKGNVRLPFQGRMG